MNYEVKLQTQTEEIPYSLLLLADETIDAIDKYIHECSIAVVFTPQNIEPIGVIALYHINENVLEIKNIAVATTFQKQGVGKQLVDFAINYGQEHHYKKLIVGTGDYSLDAFAFYTRIGFKFYGVRANFYIDNYKDPIIENGHRLKDMIVLKQCIN